MCYVYCQFPGKQAECYEFPEHVHYDIANGNIEILYQAGISHFNRVTVDDAHGFREIWRRPQRQNNNNSNNS